jgi:hypothetical protein
MKHYSAIETELQLAGKGYSPMPHLVLSSLFKDSKLRPLKHESGLRVGDILNTPLYKVTILGYPELKTVLESTKQDPLSTE